MDAYGVFSLIKRLFVNRAFHQRRRNVISVGLVCLVVKSVLVSHASLRPEIKRNLLVVVK